MTWLVSAFEPFGGAGTNSSLDVWRELKSRDWGGKIVFHGPLPVEFGGGWRHLREALQAHPEVDGVLALGQAESRGSISLESVALNWIDARIADNRGVTPPLGRFEAAGPDVRWCRIPWERFPPRAGVARSYSAGTFVCNELMYRAIEWAEARGKKAGFVHVPPVGEGPGRMPLAEATESCAAILEFLIGSEE